MVAVVLVTIVALIVYDHGPVALFEMVVVVAMDVVMVEGGMGGVCRGRVAV